MALQVKECEQRIGLWDYYILVSSVRRQMKTGLAVLVPFSFAFLS